jgi:hypothetical protein
MNITGKTFATKKEEISYMVKHKKDIAEFKKAVKKEFVQGLSMSTDTTVVKALSTSKETDTDTVIKRTIIGNTYNWLDSHGDVHLDGTFTKSISERQERIWHLHDHEHKMTAKVGEPSSIYEKTVAWYELGIEKVGTTTSLMMDSDILKDYNALMFNQYRTEKVDQHSVGMFYVKLDLAVNDPDFEEEHKVWTTNIDRIGNKADAEELGYFWAVKEAKLIEISAVLEGSNSLTPTVEAKDIEPLRDTQKNEPLKDTQNEQKNNLINFYKTL